MSRLLTQETEWLVPFTEMGDYQRQIGFFLQGRIKQFCFEYTAFKMPLKHPREDVKQAVEHTNLGLKTEVRAQPRKGGVIGINRWYLVHEIEITLGSGSQSWLHIGSCGELLKKETFSLGPTIRNSDLIDLIWGLDIHMFQNSLGNFLIQQGWKDSGRKFSQSRDPGLSIFTQSLKYNTGVFHSSYPSPAWKIYSLALWMRFSPHCSMTQYPVLDLVSVSLVFYVLDF